eukprot:scaffold26644_cov21-Phaeocystis_antarctica.AAC.1
MAEGELKGDLTLTLTLTLTPTRPLPLTLTPTPTLPVTQGELKGDLLWSYVPHEHGVLPP